MSHTEATKQHTVQVINNIKQRRFEQLTELDDRYRQVFLQWAAKRFVASANDLEDAWQEALVLFYERVLSGRIHSLDCAVSTYLFAVGGRFLLNQQRKMRRILWWDDADFKMQNQVDESLNVGYENKELLEAAMQKLSEKCRGLLTNRHFYGYDIPEIKNIFGFASENATSVHLSNCMNALKKTVQTLMK